MADDRTIFLTATAGQAIAEHGGTHVIAQARLDSATLAKGQDGVDDHADAKAAAPSETPTRLLARLLRDDSLHPLETIDGDFAGAAFFDSSKSLLLFRDKFGVAPLLPGERIGYDGFQ